MRVWLPCFSFWFWFLFLGLIVYVPSGFDDPVVLQGTTSFDLMRPPWSIVLASLVSGFRSHLSRFFWLYAGCLLQEVFITLESVILVCRWECRSGVSAPPMTHQVPKGLLVG